MKKTNIKTKFVSFDLAIALIIELIINSIAYFGTRLFTHDRYHYDLSCELDERIPLIPVFIVIYWLAYVYWIVSYILGCRQEEKTAYRFVSADFLAKIICLVTFVVFPTTISRPVVEGNGIFEVLIRMLYSTDAADNLLPSIHCLTSWFSFIAIRENKNISNIYKGTSLVIAALICISTLTTRQHVIIDVIAGIGVAEISYQLVDRIGVSKQYRRCIKGIGQIFNK